MAQILTSFSGLSQTDVALEVGSFTSTEATVTPVSDAGREFFAGQFGQSATSATLTKNGALQFAEFAAAHGIVVG